MASNYTVRIHLETFLKLYITGKSKNGVNPLVFPRNFYLVNRIFDQLISRRDYEHNKLMVNAVYDLDDYIDVRLPWQRGKNDIRNKHYLSHKHEGKLRVFIAIDFCNTISNLLINDRHNLHLLSGDRESRRASIVKVAKRMGAYYEPEEEILFMFLSDLIYCD